MKGSGRNTISRNSLLLSIIILIILILVSGFLSSSEIALSSSSRNKVKMLADKGDKRAIRLLETIDKPHNFFATTQLYITFIAFFSGAYAASSFTDPILNLVHQYDLPISDNVAEPVVFILITAVLTYFSLILGELVPKRIAMQYAIPFALWALQVLKVLSIIALPFVKFLSFSAKLVLKLLRIKDTMPEEAVTKEEIRMIVESSGEHGHIAESEQGMIENIFNIENLTAADICTHRLNITALPLDADFKSVAEMFTGEFYSRLPVYEDSVDNIKGILYSKDVLRYMTESHNPENFHIKTLMRDAYFVPLSKKVRELFHEMQKEHAYMAVVIDEYGGTLGIVTMEDLVEKIVGKIHDEYDTDELPDIVQKGENSFLIQGTTNLETVQNHFDMELPVDEYDTLSGFLVGQLQYIPSEDEKPEIMFAGLLFKVKSVKEKRIESVLVSMIEEETDLEKN